MHESCLLGMYCYTAFMFAQRKTQQSNKILDILKKKQTLKYSVQCWMAEVLASSVS